MDLFSHLTPVIYKPPNFSNPEFLDKLERTLHNVFLFKKKCIFMGDTDINTLTKTSVSKEYINLIQSEGFSQLIFEATRILKIHKVALIVSLQIFRLPAQVAALQLRLQIIYRSFLFCTIRNLVLFLIILNSETFGALKVKSSN